MRSRKTYTNTPTREEVRKGEREEERLANEYVDTWLPTIAGVVFPDEFEDIEYGWTQQKNDDEYVVVNGRKEKKKYPDIDRVILHNGKKHHYLEIKHRNVPLEKYIDQGTMIPYRKVKTAKTLKLPVYVLVEFSDGNVVLFPICMRRGYGVRKNFRKAEIEVAYYKVDSRYKIYSNPDLEEAMELWKWCGWR